MWNPLQSIIINLLRPLTRLVVGLVAIPVFRMCMYRVVRTRELDEELEKDLTQWFRASLLLLVATQNMESVLFPWVEHLKWGDWITLGFRVMLAISVVESMPDQELFSIIHPGPPKLSFRREWGFAGCCRELRLQAWPVTRGLLCQHLNRSSPVFAILAAIAPDRVGWICYGIAITQYLIIGLVTSRDKALDVLTEFDRQIAIRREELVREFDLEGTPAAASSGASSAGSLSLDTPKSGQLAVNLEPIPSRERNARDSVANPGEAGYVSE